MILDFFFLFILSCKVRGLAAWPKDRLLSPPASRLPHLPVNPAYPPRSLSAHQGLLIRK